MKEFTTSAAVVPAAIVEEAWQEVGASFERFCLSPASVANGGPTKDYIPHHGFFQYWASTANNLHARPASIDKIGHTGPANHQYDLHDFNDALKAGNLPLSAS